ncbi:hypothetical protein Pmani_004526 [Petrolisthes manimaculis]|uniref:Uncharacterized protein n=1 Tax=Petrolisthes manimaculis TaxID=1843537 RepID=A0AAE1ULH4_9EUCA|nr:hypothetical protein Pmani_004526 [Petrolisthes manimaculis]
MDINAVKVLLEAQERTIRSAMELVIDQLKERIKIAEGTVSDLIKSVEFSQAEILDLKKDISELRNSDSDKQTVINDLQSRIVVLKQCQNYQEDYNRRNNLRITGLLEEKGKETWEQTLTSVAKIFKDKLELPPVDIIRAHRTGPSLSSRPRAVIVRLEKLNEREAVIRNAKKLKGTGIYINEDLCPASLEIKNKQLPLMKKAKEEGKIAFFRHTKLIIKERLGQEESSMGLVAGSPVRGQDMGTSAVLRTRSSRAALGHRDHDAGIRSDEGDRAGVLALAAELRASPAPAAQTDSVSQGEIDGGPNGASGTQSSVRSSRQMKNK